MLLKPVRKDFEVWLKIRPAVAFTFSDDQFCRGPRFGCAPDEGFRLLDRNEGVGVAVDDQRGRQVLRHEVNGRNLAAEFSTLCGIGRAGTEGGLKIGQNADPDCVFARPAVVQEIGRGKETGDGLDGAAFAVGWVGCFLVSRGALSGEGEGEMAAGTASGHAELIGVDRVMRGILPNEADRAMDVVGDLRDREFWL